MNDKELKDLLQELRIPEPDEALKEKARHRASLALGSPDLESGKRPVRFPWLTPALAVLVLLMASYILLQSVNDRENRSPQFAAVLQEMENLFPNRISALVWRGGELTVELAEPAANTGQPVEILLSRQEDQIRVISFSGREVCVDLNGEEVCFEVILSGIDDTAILVGEHYLWTPQNPAPLSGFKVKAKPMKGAST